MAQAFAEIAFTSAVRDVQARQGSAHAYDRFLAPETDPGNTLGEPEAAFIEDRDGFYQATVSDSGWPYVQFRGGPKGFLNVIDERSIAYADFRGNRQYVSVGNLSGNDRVSLILTDYPNRRRLKILGHARTVDIADDPALLARLHDAAYRAKPERAIVITVAGLDWNCPQHIPQRMTLAELEPHLTSLRDDMAALKAENERLRALVNGTT